MNIGELGGDRSPGCGCEGPFSPYRGLLPFPSRPYSRGGARRGRPRGLDMPAARLEQVEGDCAGGSERRTEGQENMHIAGRDDIDPVAQGGRGCASQYRGVVGGAALDLAEHLPARRTGRQKFKCTGLRAARMPGLVIPFSHRGPARRCSSMPR